MFRRSTIELKRWHTLLLHEAAPSETPGGESPEARTPEQACEDGHKKDRFGLTGPNWTMKKNGDFSDVVYCIGVPDGI